MHPAVYRRSSYTIRPPPSIRLQADSITDVMPALPPSSSAGLRAWMVGSCGTNLTALMARDQRGPLAYRSGGAIALMGVFCHRLERNLPSGTRWCFKSALREVPGVSAPGLPQGSYTCAHKSELDDCPMTARWQESGVIPLFCPEVKVGFVGLFPGEDWTLMAQVCYAGGV